MSMHDEVAYRECGACPHPNTPSRERTVSDTRMLREIRHLYRDMYVQTNLSHHAHDPFGHPLRL